MREGQLRSEVPRKPKLLSRIRGTACPPRREIKKKKEKKPEKGVRREPYRKFINLYKTDNETLM